MTTDQSGEAGYNADRDTDPVDSDYTSEFSGTSAATPTVAGVVALMLDANEGLGWRDVQTILAMSASHTGSAMGGPGELEEIGAWQTVGGNTWNGGGTMFHQSYGYGMVDVYAAVRMAEAWKIMSPVAKVSSNEITATGDFPWMMPQWKDITPRITALALSPTGKRAAAYATAASTTATCSMTVSASNKRPAPASA